MLETIAMIFPLVFTNNLVMSLVKVLADGSLKKTGLRVILGATSVLGLMAASAFTGNAIDFDSVSNIAQATVLATVTGVLSHFSYKVIKQ